VARRWTLGIDVGGTFTDLVAVADDGEILATKTPSTRDQSEGVISVIGKLARQAGLSLDTLLGATTLIVHG